MECWKVARRIGSTCSKLGLQDAARKRRKSSMTPGAWAGSVVSSDRDNVRVTIAQDKWDKTKLLIREVFDLLKKDPQSLPRRRLEEVRGFLNYVCQTFRSLTPYLIGFHLTIDGWRDGRDDSGWKLPTRLWKGDVEGAPWTSRGPKWVKAVPRLENDLEALLKLTNDNTPPEVCVRAASASQVAYGFGDASGVGFGSAMEIQREVHYEYGQWISEVTQEESSNWRELNNLVETMEGLCEKGLLNNHEVFLFTDNTTAEASFWKGSSRSPKLFSLVLRLRQLEMKFGLILHVTHVSGKRMIACGVDGLSCADHSMGIMTGRPTIDFVPLHKTCLERRPSLKDWLSKLVADLNFVHLDESGWFRQGHTMGNFIWTPAPAAAEVVVEQIGKARLKRSESMHLVLVPRLFTGYWRRWMTRHADGYFRIAWQDVWPLEEEYEPLLCFLFLPYQPFRPLLHHRQTCIDEIQRIVQEPSVSAPLGVQRRDLLRELLLKARQLCPV